MHTWSPFFGAVELPGSGLNDVAPRTSASRMSPMFVIFAVLAAAFIIFLVWDFIRQKWVEKKERQRLARFRERMNPQILPRRND